RSRNAPRARGPSRRPATESMRPTLDARAWIRAPEPWTVSSGGGFMLAMQTEPRSPSTTTALAPTLVVGGTGKTGRRVAAALRARGIPVRVGSRGAQPAFDWDDRATWVPALRGVRA